ncbi:hypothetical protein AMECASPLE_039335 [Ameca splendens]|uniref:Uncharacterized protein n=1 Tax=Ameca splendens TaxID=208324 RepID=A0ABV1AFU3_9TELE
MERLLSRINEVLDRPHLDLDYFHYVINQEVFVFTSASTVLDVPVDVMECILNLQEKIRATISQAEPCVLVTEVTSGRGRPKLAVSEDLLAHLIGMALPMSCIANLLGVSISTVFRCMHELGIVHKIFIQLLI